MRKPILDRLHLLLASLTIVGWGMLFYSLVMFDEARPEMSTIITRFHHIEVRTYWLAAVYDQMFWLLWFCAGISFSSLALNWFLRVRAKDTIWFSTVMLSIVSLVAVLVLMIWHPMLDISS